MSKLRKFDTLGFRPENEAQEKLILDAQRAAGLTMAELLRRAVLIGVAQVVADAKAKTDEAFVAFEHTLREQGHGTPDTLKEGHEHPAPGTPPSYLKTRKRRPKAA